jgi:hypothetical protein
MWGPHKKDYKWRFEWKSFDIGNTDTMIITAIGDTHIQYQFIVYTHMCPIFTKKNRGYEYSYPHKILHRVTLTNRTFLYHYRTIQGNT